MIVLGFDPGAWTGYAVVDLSTSMPQVIQAGKVRADEMGGVDFIDKAMRGLELKVDLVAVEKVAFVYPRAGFSTSMATAIASATRVEGRILEAALNRQIPTKVCAAAEWRRALTGSPSPSDALVKSTLSLRIQSEQRLNAHSRDAVGVAVFCGMSKRISDSTKQRLR